MSVSADWADLHGYDRYTCPECRWSGLTDTPVCESCGHGGCDGEGEELGADPLPLAEARAVARLWRMSSTYQPHRVERLLATVVDLVTQAGLDPAAVAETLGVDLEDAEILIEEAGL